MCGGHKRTGDREGKMKKEGNGWAGLGRVFLQHQGRGCPLLSSAEPTHGPRRAPELLSLCSAGWALQDARRLWEGPPQLRHPAQPSSIWFCTTEKCSRVLEESSAQRAEMLLLLCPWGLKERLWFWRGSKEALGGAPSLCPPTHLPPSFLQRLVAPKKTQ